MTDSKICIIGLGYVGLPLAVAMAKHFQVSGYDCDAARIRALSGSEDSTGEVSAAQLQNANIQFTDNIKDAADCTVYIITVPTPLLSDKRPDLSPLQSACVAVGGVLSANDMVIIESTVYPGVTEEVCVPILESTSGLKYEKDFVCGYSPERVNPGDPNRPITTIPKVVAGSTPQAAKRANAIYEKTITAGIHLVSSIRVAEASKVIENTQRDVNIALMNEFAMLCHSLQIDSAEVFAAASSKWNFLPFTPGLVGGHCIGVDPYYLCHKAQASGYQPNLILAARQINDSMGRYIADKTIHLLAQSGTVIKNANVLILGFSFKENCPDPRNSRTADIYTTLQNAGCEVCICDPVADKDKTKNEYGIVLQTDLQSALATKPVAVIFAVAHECFTKIEVADLADAIVVDVKGFAPRSDWRL
ncbi:MAG: nucleotide sugar dehydrogenase [Gammaproteobacteria bacterium WSBS_2016_MAG_OTU1]